MDRFKKFRKIVTLLVVLFVVNTIFLLLMMPSHTPLSITVILVQAIVIVFFTVLSRGLIKEAEEMERKDDERRAREKAEQKLKSIEEK